MLPLKCSNDVQDWKSYYIPYTGHGGTVNLHPNYIPCGIEIQGAPLEYEIVVVSDVSSAAIHITNQGYKILYRNRWGLQDVRIQGRVARFIDQQWLVYYDLDKGTYYKEDIGVGTRCYDEDILCLNDGVKLNKTGEIAPAIYPRSAEVKDNILYIPDLFGHKVTAYSYPGLNKEWEIEGYFPNDLQVLDDGRVLVTEEHANRVYIYDPVADTKESVINCGLDVYADLNSTAADIEARELTGDLVGSDGKGICAGRLYSPGSTRRASNGTYLVSDTDNHRLLVLDQNGNIVTKIININNPTRARFVE